MWGAVIGLLVQVVGTLAGKALIGLGIGYATYKGIDTFVIAGKAQFFSSITGLDPATVQTMGVLQIGTAVNMLCSAILTRLAIKGMTGGAMTAMRIK